MMQTATYKEYSRHIGTYMEFKIYGNAGQPLLIFQDMGGGLYDFEKYGLIETVSAFINDRRIMLIAVGYLAKCSWKELGDTAPEIASRHNDYDAYIINELLPSVRKKTDTKQQFISTGIGAGAYHAMNFFLRHPNVFSGTISLSGIYNFRYFLPEYNQFDENIYYNSPLEYMNNLEDEWYLEKQRAGTIVICVGQGHSENDMLRDTLELTKIFRAKRIPVWIDIWGHDVNHEWDWWRKQFPFFVRKALLEDMMEHIRRKFTAQIASEQ